MKFLHEKKITPKFDLSWYVKWLATFVGIVGSLLTAINLFPLNLAFSSATCFLWIIVAVLWKDRAMIIANTAPLTISLFGILNYFFGNGV